MFRTLRFPLAKSARTFFLILLLCLTTAARVHGNGPNLLSNPTFDLNLAGWKNYFNTGFELWKPSDAEGRITSGSAQFTHNGPPPGGLGIAQCVPVIGGTSYIASATAWIPSGSPVDTHANISVVFFESIDCAATGNGSFFAGTYAQGKWTSFAWAQVAPAQARSALVLLVVTRPFDAISSTRSYFDNAFFGTGTCAPTPTQLCLNDGRFKVQVAWVKPDGTTGPGMAIPFANESGSFWFFDASNIELDVKVLNACIPALGNRFWFFAAGLTNVEVTLTVTDTRTGEVKSYKNPQGEVFKTIADTEAFSTCP